MRKQISEILKEAMTEQRTNVARLSREVGISQPTISVILDGEKNYLISQAEQIADHLGVGVKIQRATMLHDVEVEAFWRLFDLINTSNDPIDKDVELILDQGVVEVSVDYSFYVIRKSPETIYTPATYERVISTLMLGDAKFYELADNGEDFKDSIPISIDENKLYRELTANN